MPIWTYRDDQVGTYDQDPSRSLSSGLCTNELLRLPTGAAFIGAGPAYRAQIAQAQPEAYSGAQPLPRSKRGPAGDPLARSRKGCLPTRCVRSTCASRFGPSGAESR